MKLSSIKAQAEVPHIAIPDERGTLMRYPMHRKEVLLFEVLRRTGTWTSPEVMMDACGASARSIREYARTLRMVLNEHGHHVFSRRDGWYRIGPGKNLNDHWSER